MLYPSTKERFSVLMAVKRGRSQDTAARRFGYAQMLRDILIASMNKGQFPVAIIALVLIVMILKMPAADVSRLVFHVLGLLERGSLLGYCLSSVLGMGWLLHARFQRRLIQDEMRRISEQRTSLQARALGKRIRSSGGRS
jgi:ABC-type multidrug transport system permease subunit